MKCWETWEICLILRFLILRPILNVNTIYKLDFYLKICLVKIQIISTLPPSYFQVWPMTLGRGWLLQRRHPQSIIWCFIAATVFLTLFVLDLSIIPRQEVGNGSGVEMDMNYVRCVDFWQSFGSQKTEFWESILNVFRERLYNRKYLSIEIIYL